MLLLISVRGFHPNNEQAIVKAIKELDGALIRHPQIKGELQAMFDEDPGWIDVVPALEKANGGGPVTVIFGEYDLCKHYTWPDDLLNDDEPESELYPQMQPSLKVVK